MRVLVILGTRPEAIKLCPLVLALRAPYGLFEVHLCSTGQHRDLLDPVWSCFDVFPDSSLDGMSDGQGLTDSAARILASLPSVFSKSQPDLVVVQGDTTTTLCGALAAFYHGVPVAHVEAGLRSGDLQAPFPEELNRTLVSRLASLHFAATQSAAENLVHEGVPAGRIHVTGNTGIDALHLVCEALDQKRIMPRLTFPPKAGQRLLVTMHRREALVPGFPSICRALTRLADSMDIEIVFPIHPNPRVREVIARELPPHERIVLCDPLDYISFVALMRTSHLVLTDSGGIQEEAPYLGLPVVVLREKTERTEGLLSGLATLAGFDPEGIYAGCLEALNQHKTEQVPRASHSIYGDGHASARICDLISSFLSR